MGCFSWMFANTNNKRNLKIGMKGYILCPDDTFIKEENYEGYGVFSGVDVYDKVVDWNRPYLYQLVLSSKCSANPFDLELAIRAEESDEAAQKYVDNVIKNKTYDCVSAFTKTDWKRCLGIFIACYDNCNLPFPIKIVSKQGCKYSETPASHNDPNQGFY